MDKGSTRTMRLFLNYRHEDTGFAGRLSDSLEAVFGHGSVSRYVNDPDLTSASDRSAAQQIRAIDAVLVMIGPRWLDAQSGQRKLDRSDDFVRLQIEAALAENKTVIAVLVNGATMPDSAALPAAIEALAHCEAFSLNDATWSADVDRLVTRLRPTLPVPISAAAPRLPEESSGWLVTAALVGAVLLLGAFLLTSRFWLDETPPVVGVWAAEVQYGDGRAYDERFEFRLTGRELSGSASYRGGRRAIEGGTFANDQLSFVVRTRERRGLEQLELRHSYMGVVANSRIAFTLQTSGDTIERAPVEFEARPISN
jgi:hypothetical protein